MEDKAITSILELLADEAVPPDSVNLWHNIRQQCNSSEQRQLPPVSRLGFFRFFSSVFFRKSKLVLVLMLALIISGIFLFTHAHPVNAQEILQRAQSVMVDLHANGISSFEMISETISSATVPNGIVAPPVSSGAIQSQLHTWYQETDHWRYEMRFVDEQHQYEAPQITIADGTSIWSYDPKRNFLQIHDGVIGNLGKGNEPGIYGLRGGLDAILKSADQCYDPAVIGEDTMIAGRKTYTLYLGSSKCPRVAAAAFDGPQTIWIDQQTYFILKREIKDIDNEVIIYSMTVTDIHYNHVIDPGIFTLQVPDGTTIFDDRANPQGDNHAQ